MKLPTVIGHSSANNRQTMGPAVVWSVAVTLLPAVSGDERRPDPLAVRDYRERLTSGTLGRTQKVLQEMRSHLGRDRARTRALFSLPM